MRLVKQHDAYLRDLRRQGYVTIRKIHSNHLRVFCPDGHLVSTYPVNGGSDWRGLRNFQAEVRRHELWHSAAQQDNDHDDDQDQDDHAHADVHQAPCR